MHPDSLLEIDEDSIFIYPTIQGWKFVGTHFSALVVDEEEASRLMKKLHWEKDFTIVQLTIHQLLDFK